MRDVILLLKLQMRGFLSINRLRNRLGDGKTALLMAVCSVCTLTALVLAGFYCFMIAYGMNEMGLLALYPPLTVAISCLFGLFTAIYKAPHVLFSQDDMLLSLPISAKGIVASRFLQLYCYSLISDILIMIPALTAYVWYARPDVGFCLRYLLAVPFIPVMPLMVGCLLGAAVQAIASRFRHTNLVVILGGFALMLGLLYFQMQIPKMVRMQDLFLGLEHLLSTWIGRIYPLAGLYTQGVMEGHWLSLMGYIVLALAIFAAMIHLVAHFFKPICSGLSGVRAKARFQMRSQRRKLFQHPGLCAQHRCGRAAAHWRISCPVYDRHSSIPYYFGVDRHGRQGFSTASPYFRADLEHHVHQRQFHFHGGKYPLANHDSARDARSGICGKNWLFLEPATPHCGAVRPHTGLGPQAGRRTNCAAPGFTRAMRVVQQRHRPFDQPAFSQI